MVTLVYQRIQPATVHSIHGQYY